MMKYWFNFWVLIALSLPTLSLADIYAFLDENGIAHFSNAPKDERYQLFKKGGDLSADAAEEAQPNLPLRVPTQQFMQLVERAAQTSQMEPALLHAVIAAESGYNSTALSPKGATGLMQLMPETGKRYGVSNLLDPAQNILGGARYLRDLMRLFKNDMNLVLAAYNAGEGAVIKHGYKIPPYRETMLYVPKVLQYYKQYQSRETAPIVKRSKT